MSNNVFVIGLKLNTEPYQEDILNKRLEIGRKMYNQTLSYANKRVTAMRESRLYRKTLKLYLNSSGQEKKAYGKELDEIRKSFGLSEWQLHSYIKKQQHIHKDNIDSNTSQKIASRVWVAISDLIFRDGKKVHFSKHGNFNSLEGKSNSQGIRFRDNQILWNKLIIPVKLRCNDKFDKFLKEHDNCISSLENSNKKLPSSLGAKAA